ncbi:protocadherin beta-16-like isoform X5 [Alosa sapidissima]|uniref:protocadherin beta-16-like isoform X5 n=1 Tax=Alosa sapidissima TaxID=34773 RepID=UPI001C0946D2|nr:protocadherin beta-16-like isoform X5 [Alosa sapidissima]
MLSMCAWVPFNLLNAGMYRMDIKGVRGGDNWKQISLLLLLYISVVTGQVRYSIPEEMSKGSVVGHIAEDLGIDLKRLHSGRARIVAGDNSPYVELNTDKGTLVVSERIDRELLCKQISPCSFNFEMILENPIQLYEVTIEILDVNDHSPTFPREEIAIEISESAIPGARFLLDRAYDPDVGINAIQGYTLKPGDNFILKHENRPDRNKFIELILQSPVDRESKDELSLILTASDGGKPPKTGQMRIKIKVLDINDNAPRFSKEIYRASIPENAPVGKLVTTVSASDADKGVNGEVLYSLRQVDDSDIGLFTIDENSGEITVSGDIDFEKTKKFDLNVEVKDHGGLTDSCVVIIDVIDVNDNTPVISLTSFTNPVPENAPVGTTVAVISVKDADSGVNGQVSCTISKHIPFVIKLSLRNYYTLLTDESLDREINPEYNITITITDDGSPSLSTTKRINLKISDVNDNRPIFDSVLYTASVDENISPGVSIFTVRAEDADCCQNSRVTYLLEETQINGAPASSLVSINAETGVIYAARSFDYEQLRGFKISVRAQDSGSPPLSGNATVQILIQDQNDNAPQILYPVQTGVSALAEIVPRSADIGYLVTKVVAVDGDSGQNAWLSYKLHKPADRPLFEVGAQNGEIRTVRQVTDKDAVKQKLTVVVEDNGQPSRSATVNVNVAVADSFPEVLLEFTDFTHNKDHTDDLTFYLILALAVVSFLFISCLVAIISVKIYRWRQSRMFYQSSLPVIPYYPPQYGDTAGTGTLQRVYNYEVCMTTDSRKSDLKCMRPGSQSIISLDTGGTLTLPLPPRDKAIFDTDDNQHVYNYEVCGTTDSRMSDVKRIRPYSQNTLVSLSRPGTVQREKMQQQDADFSTEQKPPNNDWRLPPNQRPGPSGQHRFHTIQQRWTPYEKSRAGPLPEGAGVVAGTGPWPQPPTEAEQLQALMAGANAVNEATATLGPRYNAQYVPDYRQNVYIPGSTATLTANPQQQQQPQQALPPPAAMPPVDVPKAAQTPASKKKSTKKDKK